MIMKLVELKVFKDKIPISSLFVFYEIIRLLKLVKAHTLIMYLILEYLNKLKRNLVFPNFAILF